MRKMKTRGIYVHRRLNNILNEHFTNTSHGGVPECRVDLLRWPRDVHPGPKLKFNSSKLENEIQPRPYGAPHRSPGLLVPTHYPDTDNDS